MQRNPSSADTSELLADASNERQMGLYRVYEICPCCDRAFFPEATRTEQECARSRKCPDGCEVTLEVVPYYAIRL